ncbi:accessory factor UbiK family protein [uncultured Thiothrix sp.]|mgnify:CR=1 FL=1|uniref:accessory factor UbiK family protein n=1 Tax=uncultured Thiothrix sp. TaxID=223185 RepID=UPI00262D3889|nr:accessory factor UbiK family protein [uncultured Thiothrix sp.]
MSNPLDDMMKKFSELLPEPVRNMQEDFEKNMRGVMEAGLQKMNLVTREEFDIQTAVLQRTREKLEALEARLNEWENKQASATNQNEQGGAN